MIYMLAVTPKTDTLPATAEPSLEIMFTRALDRILLPPLLTKWKDLITESVMPKKIAMFKHEMADQLQQYKQEIMRYFHPILTKVQQQENTHHIIIELLSMIEALTESQPNPPLENSIEASLAEELE